MRYYTGIDGVLLSGIKCQPFEKRSLGQIQQKLEKVQFQFKPQKDPKMIDLSKFIKNVSSSSSSELEQVEVLKDEKSLSDLPYEILFKIFSFLDLRSIFRCSQVCSSFQQLSADPMLYLEVNLKFYWNFVDDSLIDSLSKRCSLVKKLDMSGCGMFGVVSSKTFNDFIKSNGNHLTHIRISVSFCCLKLLKIHANFFFSLECAFSQ